MEFQKFLCKTPTNLSLTAFRYEENAVLTWFDKWLTFNLRQEINVWDGRIWVYQSPQQLTRQPEFKTFSRQALKRLLKVLSNRLYSGDCKKILSIVPLQAMSFRQNKRVSWYSFTPEFIKYSREFCEYSFLISEGAADGLEDTLQPVDRAAASQRAPVQRKKRAKKKAPVPDFPVVAPENGNGNRKAADKVLTFALLRDLPDDQFNQLTQEDFGQLPPFIMRGDPGFDSYKAACQAGAPALRKWFKQFLELPEAQALMAS
jgi:hypothetical protein